METTDRDEAERIVFDKNEALKTAAVNHRIGMNYLSASDSLADDRTGGYSVSLVPPERAIVRKR